MVGCWSLEEHFVEPVTNLTWNLIKGKDVLDTLEDQHSPQSQETLKMAVAAIKFITLQKQLGGYFMLEHLVSSSLWKMPSVKDLVQEEAVHQTDFHMCAHGMRSSDPQDDGFVLRPTRAHLDGVLEDIGTFTWRLDPLSLHHITRRSSATENWTKWTW